MTGKEYEIERNCVECGKTVEITVEKDRAYDGGHYLGEFTVPDEDSEGEYEKTGEWKGFEVVKWTGEEESFEYWACDDCFSSEE